MRKGVINLLVFLMVFSFAIHFSIAANVTACDSTDENCKVSAAYSCLNEKIGDCSKITSYDEKVFSLISTGKCQSQVTKDPNYRNDLRYTSLALIGLDKSGGSKTDAENWLLSKNSSTTNLNWYLQIESSNATTCSLTYGGNTYSNVVSLSADKKISLSGAGSCFTVSPSGYWLQVNPSCYGKDLGVSCANSFLTTLLYQKVNDNTFYITENAHSSSSGGTTTEKVNSLCFKKANTNQCDYEGSLWAALALDSAGKDVSPYLPYLTTGLSENARYLPESFLFSLTGQFKAELLSLQKNSQYWSVSGDNYYDTALALLPLQYQDELEKQNSKSWLLQVQAGDGCWNSGSLRDTAFILYSIWPGGSASSSGDGGETSTDCESAGNYCRSSLSCGNDDGRIINDLTCAGILVCCDTPQEIQTCSEQEGEICNSNKECVGGTTSEASDTSLGQTCCISGTCEAKSSSPPGETSSSQCDQAGGTCRSAGCLPGETESAGSCDFTSDVCCVPSSKTGSGTSMWWIWVLLVLIALAVLAIIFRQKLMLLWFRIKSGFGGGPSPASHPGNRPSSPPPGFLPRRMIPIRRPMQAIAAKPKEEINDVLKKLKEMGK